MFKLVPPVAVLVALALAAPAHAFGHHRVAVVGVPMSAGCSAPAYMPPAATYAAAPVATYAAPVTTYAAAPVATYAAPAPAVQMVPVSLAPVQMVAPQATYAVAPQTTYAVAPQAAYAPPQSYRLVPQQQTMPRADDCGDSFGRRDSYERLGQPRAGPSAGAGPSTGELSDRLDRLSRAVEELAGNVRQLQKK